MEPGSLPIPEIGPGMAELLRQRISRLWPSETWNVIVESGGNHANWNEDPKEQIHVQDDANHLGMVMFSRRCWAVATPEGEATRGWLSSMLSRPAGSKPIPGLSS